MRQNSKSLKNGANLVDAETFISHNSRRFVLNGAPSTNMCGLDIIDHWDLEFEKILDHEKFHADYIESDILRLDSSPEK
ncbi:uncharacterized protein EAF02_004398 [Botrytis sinoallii]|uniref:uncharacterized protein n=1 Tax=Botrytis sinoallii TaxID=1463999 RepID=UPI0018FF4298|nr:uncharacterized protein EAF02_004398 [Botrytis sinoallii]KAF7885889.1 hypothetical protein EAF02_004398 [Botrytis sinoallii]